MPKQKLLLIASVIFIEVLIFYWANYLSDDKQVYFQLAARYSARFSFLLFAGILFWVGKSGLNQIFSLKSLGEGFVFLFFLFDFNHLIHFYFLYMNFQVNGFVLFGSENLAGGLGYLTLLIIPFLLWKKTALSPVLYWGTHSALFFLWIIFAVSYAKRLIKDYPFPPSTFIITFNLVLLSGLFIFYVYGIIKEVRRLKPTVN